MAKNQREAKSMRDLGEETFRLDGKFLKREAKEALRSYFMPFSGIYAAATGKRVVLVRDLDSRNNRKPQPEKKRA